MSSFIPLRILVVEDEPIVARDLQRALTHGGYEVTGLCSTGEEALDAVQLQQPDLVLMDIGLQGGMDGIQAAAKVQREHHRPVVFLTGHADEQTTLRARAAEPYGYLLKPFHEGELRSVVELAVSRHRADRKLRASEERFVSTLRSMADGVISTDVLGIINFMNPVAEKLTGWTLAQAKGRPLHEIFRVSLPGGESVEPSGLVNDAAGLRTLILTDKEGVAVPIEDSTTPIRDGDGALTGIVVLFRRKEGHAPNLPLPEVPGTPWPNLASIVSSISDPLLALNDEWRITYLNSLAARALGGRREDLLGTFLWDCLPASVHHLYYHDFSTAMSQRTARSFEMEIEARRQWYEVQLYPFGPGVLALLRDVTGRKQAEEQQNKLEKLESLGLLARGFAHDFNNLLTVLLGNLSLAEMNFASDAPGANELRTARQATVQAQNLVQQLLTFARGGAPIRQPTDAGRLVQEWFAEWPKRPGIDYRMAVSGDHWQAEVDRHQIRRLLSNLMKNAEQAVGREGIISLRLVRPEHVGLGPADIGLPPEAHLEDWILLEMVDNGEGISPENLDHVFEPYFTTRQDANASGLGLTVVESIARAHDGAVRLLSALGEGTRVRVALPASTPLSPHNQNLTPAPAAAEVPPHPSGSRRVLILEDEPLIRQILVQCLKSSGCEVTQTTDGAETVARYEEALAAGRPYDLLITDLSIPGGMGGAAALEKIRHLDPGVRAIVSSGYSDDPVMSRYLDFGFRAVLPKPYHPPELRELVEQLLSEGRP
jgi:two-component system cell cycle sensor histidine kinase/response regulator CckA